MRKLARKLSHIVDATLYPIEDGQADPIYVGEKGASLCELSR